MKDCIKSFNSKRMRKGIWIVFAKSSRSKRKLKGSVYSYRAVQIICISFVERFLAYSWALQPSKFVLSVRYMEDLSFILVFKGRTFRFQIYRKPNHTNDVIKSDPVKINSELFVPPGTNKAQQTETKS